MIGKSRSRPHLDSPLLYALSLLLYLSVLIRLVLRPAAEGIVGPVAYALMAGFLALGTVQVPVARRWPAATHAYLFLQCVVVTLLFLTEPTIDFYGILYIALSIVASRDLPNPWDVAWTFFHCVAVTVGLMLAFGMAGAAAYIPIYVAGCLLLGLYGRSTRMAEAARARSEELRAELEDANRKLRAFAQQAEEAAAAQERARLSRELHDAATQTVFSMNLTAEAARAALVDDPAEVPGLVERLQALARDALAELRSLVHELRPLTVAEQGLVHALQRHAATRERRDRLAVRLSVQGEERGSLAAREALYGAALEGLNNVVKHAGVSEASVDLTFGGTEAVIRVSDAGIGFDESRPAGSECVGLLAMRERVEALHGRLLLHAAPGRGTTVEVRVPLGERDTP